MTRRALLRRASGLLLAAVAGLLGPLSVADAAPRAKTPTIDVQVTGIAPAVLQPDGELQVDVTLRNDGLETVARPRASVLVWRHNLTSRTALAAWVAGSNARSATLVTSVDAPGPLEPGQSVPLHVAIPAGKLGFTDTPDAWGARGVEIEGGDASEVLGAQRTFLLWQPTGSTAGRADLAVLVPAVGPAVGSPASDAASTSAGTTVDAATAARLQQLTASGERLDSVRAVLADPAARDVGAVLDPQLLDLARAAGGDAASWASSLTSTLADHDVATLPWGDVDAAATVHGGGPGLTAAAVTRSDAARVPGHRVGSVLWTPTAPDRATAGLVPSLGLKGLLTPVGAPTSAVAEDRASTPVQSAPTDTGDARVLVPDPVLTALFTDPTSVESGATTATATQRLLAELSVLARRPSTSTALVAPGRDWDPDTSLVSAELQAVTDSPWSAVKPLSSLLDAKPEPASLPRMTPTRGELAPAQVQALDGARQRAVAFSGVTSDPDTVLDQALDSLLPPLAVAWRADAAGRDQLVSAAVAGISTATTGLSIAPLSDINVISTSSDIRVSVHNDLAVAATVHLQVAPRKACLEVTQPAPFTVAAHAEAGVVVQLHATANCQVTVVTRLTNPSGVDVAKPVQFTARVAPTIENVGTIVVGILLAIGLVLGIVRTVRRGQSARRGARLEGEAADAPVVLAPLGGVGVADGPTTRDQGQESAPQAAAPPPEPRGSR